MPQVSTPAQLSVGDLLPELDLTDDSGKSVSLYNQQISGDPVIMLLLSGNGAGPESVAELSELAACQGDLGELRAHVFVVTGLEPAANRAIAREHRLEQRVLSDATGLFLRSFGVGVALPARTIVLRPSMRIARIVDGGAQARRALESCRTLFPVHADAPVISHHAPVLVVEDVFPAEFCQFLIDLWERGEKQSDLVTSGGERIVRSETKKRMDHVIFDPKIAQRIQFYFSRRLVPEVAKAFHFRVLRAENYRIGCYEATGDGGYFRRHRDTGRPNTDHRRYAISLNLNGDFEGGFLRFPEYGPQCYLPPTGGGVVFSCSLLHEALPVTSGRRFGLFTFFSGEQMAEGWTWHSLGSLLWQSTPPAT